MAEFELDPKTIDYDALPPLVPKGVDTESVLGPLIRAWAMQCQLAEHDDEDGLPGVVLDRVALVDGNTGEPINLGYLLTRIQESATEDAPSAVLVPGQVVALRGCSVPEMNAMGCTVRCHLITTACQFGATDVREAEFGGYTWFKRASFIGDALFEGTSFGVDAEFTEASFNGGAGFSRASFAGDTSFTAASFVGNAEFVRTSFGGHANFDEASFGSHAKFDKVSFGEHAGFISASFNGHAEFEGATFNGGTDFFEASFVWRAEFDGASFGGSANFIQASFGGTARFEGATFSDDALYEGASFGDFAAFNGATFHRKADFYRTSFGNGAKLQKTTFGDVACFDRASFCGGIFAQGTVLASQPEFARCRFSDQQFFHVEAAFATAVFQTDNRDTASFGRPVPARCAPAVRQWWRQLIAWCLQGFFRAKWRAWSRGDAHRLRWDVVRGFGELAILTRVSMSALVLVPILAAVWPAVRGAVERLGEPYGVLPPMMPWAWAALFFAAVFVVVGRVLYQAHAPQEVRESSRVDFTARRGDAYRQAEPDERRQLLREAIEAVDEAGTDAVLRWFRHRRLVRHHGRVVWIPDRIEDFEYEPTELPPPKPDSAQDKAGQEDAQQDDGEQDDAPQDGEERKPRYTAKPVMPPESRKMIAVRAGADARYDLIARQNRQWARFALWCYTLAVVLVVIVLWDQSVAVLRETGMARPSDVLRWALPALALLALVTIALWVVWDAWMGWVRWPWLARRWERLKKARGSFTPIDEMQAEIQRRLGKAGRHD